MRCSTVLVFCLAALPALAQRPSISAGGVVNAASFASVNGPSHALVPGAIATIFGQNLAAEVATAQAYPLPTSISGTSVTVNGVSAPIFYVSPSQINFQVPSSTDGGTFYAYGQASVVVSTPGGSSEPAAVDVWFLAAPGIFTQDGSGCGAGAIINLKPDGTRSLNSPSNSASPGDFLEVYGTGFGQKITMPADGSPAPLQPLTEVLYGGGEFFGRGYFGLTEIKQGRLTFMGAAPGLVGVDQLDVGIPAGIREGCAVPLQVDSFETFSQPVTVSIHSGGGPCVDPPTGGAGVLILKKSVVLNDPTIPEVDTLAASFVTAPGQNTTIFPVSETTANDPFPPGPACTVPGYHTLDPGAITITGPGGASVRVQMSPGDTLGWAGGSPVYQATLPQGFVQPGSYQISAAGGPVAGPFQASVDVGQPIQITSQFPQGQLHGINPFKVAFTGGTAGTVVTLRAVAHFPLYDRVIANQDPATAGFVSLPDGSTGSLGGSNQEIDVEVYPDPALAARSFPVPGLSMGTQVMWVYQYRFVGLTQ